jgi:hypothetical protein
LIFPFRKFRRNNKGVLYSFLVVIITLVACGFFWFLMANVVQGIQEAVNPSLVESNWIASEIYTAFTYASLFITNFWSFFLVILVLGVSYWIYIYSQRKRYA